MLTAETNRLRPESKFNSRANTLPGLGRANDGVDVWASTNEEIPTVSCI
jgi:hypothetical protein